MPTPKTERTVELRDDHWAYLERMADEHGLSDAGKAMRVLIDFAQDEPGEESRIFDEIRCLHC
jgi:hypothetical protein